MTDKNLEEKSNIFNHLNDHPPDEGDILESIDGNALPCQFEKCKETSRSKWFTYAVIDIENEGWYLGWNPVKGMVVLFEPASHKYLFENPWVKKVQIVRRSKNNKALIAKIIDENLEE